MKKILHVVDSLERGGQETFLLDLAITQKKMGYKVEIICIFTGGILIEKAEQNDISVVALTECKYKILGLKKAIDNFKPDVIHTHNRAPAFITLLAKFTYFHKIVNTRHGNGVRGLYWTIAAFFIKKIINVSEDLYQESNFLNRKCLSYKNVVIKNGIVIPTIISNNNNLGRLIIVGRLNSVKNHSLALHIIKECLNQNLPVTLDIVGDGPEYSFIQFEIKSLALEGHVNLLGDRNDVNDLLSHSDLFLLTSLSEGHSIALLEACATGLPAIVSNVGGNSEIVQNNVSGFINELDDVDGFVKNIKILILDRNRRYEMSKSAREWSLENASMESCAKEYLKIYP
jgi:glycosyltransferase involved in cell wall biosynthesis